MIQQWVTNKILD
ncbi:hypothetical protein CP8484711_1100, partial [Chlamydia psittaci 84-8471/1]